MERTLSIIKPDAVARGLIGQILSCFEAAALKIVAARFVHLRPDQARAFYSVHKDRPFYESLTEYMSCGPILVCVLEGDGAIQKNREIMGATDPAKATAGTIRKKWGTDVEKNAVHGSDAPQTAAWEIAFFFRPEEIHGAAK
jgi:nucleoside-diphosphate kinase